MLCKQAMFAFCQTDRQVNCHGPRAHVFLCANVVPRPFGTMYGGRIQAGRDQGARGHGGMSQGDRGQEVRGQGGQGSRSHLRERNLTVCVINNC